MSSKEEGSIDKALWWMLLLSILLFWLPLLGAFIAGFVGGRRSGGIGNAIAAVFLPGIVFGIILFSLATAISGIPIIGAIAAGGGVVLAFSHVGPLLVGAIIGALFIEKETTSIQETISSVNLCPNCSSIINIDDEICPGCGTDLSPRKEVCTKCNHPYFIGHNYCSKCKAPLNLSKLDMAKFYYEESQYLNSFQELQLIENIDLICKHFEKEKEWIKKCCIQLLEKHPEYLQKVISVLMKTSERKDAVEISKKYFSEYCSSPKAIGKFQKDTNFSKTEIRYICKGCISNLFKYAADLIKFMKFYDFSSDDFIECCEAFFQRKPKMLNDIVCYLEVYKCDENVIKIFRKKKKKYI